MKILLLTLAISATCLAQSNCDLRTVTDTTAPIYPPIARAAHVWGTIIMIATFERDGSVENTRVLSGPQMLQRSAVEYVKGWRANGYSGIRNCPIVINYVLDRLDTETNQMERTNSQHVTIHGQTVCLCDPEATLGKRKRHFWFF